MKKYLITLVTLSTLTLNGCSSLQKISDVAESNSVNPIDKNSIEIEYVMNHNLHQLVFWTENGAAMAQNIKNKVVLDSGKITIPVFAEYIKKADEFANRPRRVPASASACRNPFKIKIQVSETLKITQGCRPLDEGAISRLIREGEFLLYSATHP